MSYSWFNLFLNKTVGLWFVRLVRNSSYTELLLTYFYQEYQVHILSNCNIIWSNAILRNFWSGAFQYYTVRMGFLLCNTGKNIWRIVDDNNWLCHLYIYIYIYIYIYTPGIGDIYIYIHTHTHYILFVWK